MPQDAAAAVFLGPPPGEVRGGEPPAGPAGPPAASSPLSVRAELCRFLLPLVLPGLLQGKSQTIVNPMLPIFVREDLHGSDSAAGAMASAYALAQFLSSGPLGVALARLHYDAAGCLALGVLIAIASLSFLSPSVAFLFVVRLAGGVASAGFDLSRKALIAAEVPGLVRGRTTALLAAMEQWATMLAAILSGFIAQHVATRSIFLVQAAFSLAALGCLALHQAIMWRSTGSCALSCRGQDSGSRQARGVSLGAVAKQHWRDLAGAGLFCSVLAGLRQSFMVALPLHARSIHMSKQDVGFVEAVCRGADAAVTLVAAGSIMDKCGNKVGAVPALLLVGLAFVLLPLSRSYFRVLLAALIYGVGSGLAGGMLNNFAAALAPARGRTQFLGLWKMTTALGDFLLPQLMGAISDRTGSRELATITMACVAFFDIFWLLLMVHQRPSDESLHVGPATSQLSQMEVLAATATAPCESASAFG